MSSLATEDISGGNLRTPQQIEEHWKDRILAAKSARTPFVPIWLLNLAFAAGQHWVAWDRRQQRVRALRELDPKYADRELFTADRITELRLAQLAELDSEDDRPTMLAVQEGPNAEAATDQLNRAIEHAWNNEWRAQAAIAQARRYTVDLGTSAIRCRWDKTQGREAGLAPHVDGQPVTDPNELASLQQNGTLSDGSLPQILPVKEGRTVWETYSSFGILAQPGVNHEDQFTWEILVRPVPLDDLKDQYPAAGTLTPDPDIASAMGLSTSQTVPDSRSQTIGSQKLKGHVWVYTCFQRPNRRYPNGAVAIIASNEYKLMDLTEQLPYKKPDGTWDTGVRYFHWDRKNDRFYSRAWIEPLKDPQRIINRRETQNTEIIDRAMPRHYVKMGDLPESPAGVPMEVVELARNADPPQFWQGSGPGPWMQQDIDHQIDNLAHASTIAAIRLGENPPGVDTFSQLAQLNENEQSKRAIIIHDHRKQIAGLTELGVYDIRTYWPTSKQILIGGDEDQISVAQFSKQTIPDFYLAKVDTGASMPSGMAAEIKKIDAIWAAAVQSWVAVQDGATWLEWYYASLAAGKALDLPAAKANTQTDLANLENELMEGGQQPQVMDYDNLQTHLPIHREAEDQARAKGDIALLARIIRHIQDHQNVAQQNIMAAQQTAMSQGQPPSPDQQGPQPPQPREPYPNRIGQEFGQLAAGQGQF